MEFFGFSERVKSAADKALELCKPQFSRLDEL